MENLNTNSVWVFTATDSAGASNAMLGKSVRRTYANSRGYEQLQRSGNISHNFPGKNLKQRDDSVHDHN
jgi:hypothetical protein